ncbi:MAG: hypothetical protein JKY61_05595 [Planctomycetes bacterium]|nr:hypothetical protein [Planctomycetota bacterium]
MLAILAEVESNPNSKFLKLPIHLGNPGTHTQTLTGTETFLTSAEKKLVRSYREEAAEFLYFRGVESLTNSTWGRGSIVNRVARVSKGEVRYFSEQKWNKLDQALVEMGILEKSSLVESRSMTPVSMFTLANRLLPKSAYTVMLGSAQLEEGNLQGAAQRFKQVLHSPKTRVTPFAAENLGLLYWQCKDYRRAAMAYSWASNHRGRVLEHNSSVLISGAFSGQKALVTSATRRLREHGYFDGHDEVKGLIETLVRSQTLPAKDGSSHVFISNQTEFEDPLAMALLAPYNTIKP